MAEDDFRSPGIDYDIEHRLMRQLNADHRYLHIGYVRLKHGKKWGDWTVPRIEKYHARIVDALRNMGYKYLPSGRTGLVSELDKESEKYNRVAQAAGATEGDRHGK
jgi:hypothetical protein